MQKKFLFGLLCLLISIEMIQNQNISTQTIIQPNNNHIPIQSFSNINGTTLEGNLPNPQFYFESKLIDQEIYVKKRDIDKRNYMDNFTMNWNYWNDTNIGIVFLEDFEIKIITENNTFIICELTNISNSWYLSYYYRSKYDVNITDIYTNNTLQNILINPLWLFYFPSYIEISPILIGIPIKTNFNVSLCLKSKFGTTYAYWQNYSVLIHFGFNKPLNIDPNIFIGIGGFFVVIVIYLIYEQRKKKRDEIRYVYE